MNEFTSKIFLSRPISARKTKKNLLFSQAVSSSRLRKVQHLLRKDGASKCLSRVDGILCIAGIDSRYHSGTKQLLNYLLFGYCDLSADSLGPRVSDEALEDLVIFIKAESVHVYCNPINYPILLPLIGHWRNLHIHCLHGDEYDENDEESEEFKIRSFISMVRGTSVIGIPDGYDCGATVKPPKQGTFDHFIVEKWPLVQAFAFEDFGGGGFFTMKHEVVSVGAELQGIYGLLDPVSLESLITKTLPLFEHQCKSVLTNVDVDSSDLQQLTEKQTGEPVVSYYAHGHFSDGKHNSHSGSPCPPAGLPFVLFGTNTSRDRLEAVGKTREPIASSSAVGASGLCGSPAKHMVCYAVEPHGTITCARSYFFQTGFVPHAIPGVPNNGNLPRDSADLRLLMDLYCAMIDAVLEGISTYVRTRSVQQSQSAVLKVMKLGAEKRAVKLEPGFWPTHMEFSMKAQDLLGRSVPLSPGATVAVLKSASLYLYDIPSAEQPGRTLGSLAFGESFADSVVRILEPESEDALSTCCIVLTENVPRFVSWQSGNEEKMVSKQLREFVESTGGEAGLGALLAAGDPVFLAGPNAYSKWEKGNLFVYQRGLLFSHPRLGFLALPMTELKQIQFYDQDTPSSAALLSLTYSASLKSHVPRHLTTDTNSLVVALVPKSNIFRQFYSQVLHSWKASDAEGLAPFEVTRELPDSILNWYSCLQKWTKLDAQTTGGGLESARVLLSSFEEYTAHLSLSSVGGEPVQPADLPLLLGAPPTPAPDQQKLELLLTVITGVPGSGKDALCAAMLALAKEDSRWLVLRKPVDHSGPFDPTKFIQDSLGTVLASQRRMHARRAASKLHRPRVLLVTPGFTDIVDVVRAITNHPDAQVTNSVKIGAVTCCVDPRNMFMEHRRTLPKLLDQCAQGWVNNVVFTSCLEPKDEQLAFVQKLVRACNPQAAFILAKGGEVTRTPDVHLILSNSAFTEQNMVRNRHLTCPGWCLDSFSSGPAEPPVCLVRLTFYETLEKSRFVSALGALQGPMTESKIRETGAVQSVEGQIRFTDESTLTEVTWSSLNGTLKTTKVESAVIPRPPGSHPAQNGPSRDVPTFFMTFTGFGLNENNLKDWLRGCCKQKPQKKLIRTRKDLSKKEIEDYNSQHSRDPLPAGWFYNGVSYVSMTGEKNQHHPSLEEFLEKHLEQLNAEARRHNAQVDAMPATDVFQKPRTA